MVVTRKISQKMSNISTRKVGVVDCLSKGIPDNLWCLNCSYSNNLTSVEKIKPCCHPWIFEDNSTIFQKKKVSFYSRLQKKQTRPSSNIIDDIILSQTDDLTELIGENYDLEDHIIDRLVFSYK